MPVRLALTSILTVLLAAAATLLLTPAPALACTCAPPSPPRQAIEDAGAVFSGDVLSTSLTDHDLTATIEVGEVWKGDVDEVVEVATWPDGPACGFWFEEGAELLVYADLRDDGRLWTHVCARSRVLDGADEDLAALGTGNPPVPDDRGGTGATGTAARVGWLAAGGAAFVVVIGTAFRRAGRR